eukprot:scaffold718_cov342-Pavlova_lutheri.AAC.14
MSKLLGLLLDLQSQFSGGRHDQRVGSFRFDFRGHLGLPADVSQHGQDKSTCFSRSGLGDPDDVASSQPDGNGSHLYGGWMGISHFVHRLQYFRRQPGRFRFVPLTKRPGHACTSFDGDSKVFSKDAPVPLGHLRERLFGPVCIDLHVEPVVLLSIGSVVLPVRPGLLPLFSPIDACTQSTSEEQSGVGWSAVQLGRIFGGVFFVFPFELQPGFFAPFGHLPRRRCAVAQHSLSQRTQRHVRFGFRFAPLLARSALVKRCIPSWFHRRWWRIGERSTSTHRSVLPSLRVRAVRFRRRRWSVGRGRFHRFVSSPFFPLLLRQELGPRVLVLLGLLPGSYVFQRHRCATAMLRHERSFELGTTRSSRPRPSDFGW